MRTALVLLSLSLVVGCDDDPPPQPAAQPAPVEEAEPTPPPVEHTPADDPAAVAEAEGQGAEAANEPGPPFGKLIGLVDQPLTVLSADQQCTGMDDQSSTLVRAGRLQARGNWVLVPFQELRPVGADGWVCLQYEGVPGTRMHETMAFVIDGKIVSAAAETSYPTRAAAMPDFNRALEYLKSQCASFEEKNERSYGFTDCGGGAGSANLQHYAAGDQHRVDLYFATDVPLYERLMDAWKGPVQ